MLADSPSSVKLQLFQRKRRKILQETALPNLNFTTTFNIIQNLCWFMVEVIITKSWEHLHSPSLFTILFTVKCYLCRYLNPFRFAHNELFSVI